MNEKLNDILSRVAVESLEKLAFIFSFPEEDNGDMDYDSAAAAGVSFTGPFSGSLIITISRQVLVELTSNMLGVNDGQETTPDQQEDALKETINIICGNLLPFIAGEQAVFNIDTPEIIAGADAIKNAVTDSDGRKPASSVKLDIDDEQCALFLFGDIQVVGGLVE